MEIIDERTKNRKTLEYLDSGTMFLDNEGRRKSCGLSCLKGGI